VNDLSAIKTRVQRQFTPVAERYAVSVVHSRGQSLERLVALTTPQSHQRVLDVATAVGHTALRFAPHVRQVVGADLTPATLAVARRLAAERGVTNVTWVAADAEALPLPDACFDIVTCRLALHHMPRASRAVAEMTRVCRLGGYVALADNLVPEDPAAARWINAFERLRDPSHHRVRPLSEMLHLFQAAGLQVEAHETFTKAMDFEDWTWRMDVTPSVKDRLRSMLLEEAPPAVADWLAPTTVNGRLTFHLVEGVFVGRKVG